MTNTTPFGDRTAVDIRAIEHELNEIWQHASEDGSPAVTRVCVLNLVVGVYSNRTAEHATQVVSQLTARHPNRALVVHMTPDSKDNPAPDMLDAWVQAHCQMPGPGRPQVCCEQITIEASGAAATRVPGLVLTLLVPDVPVMLWWPSHAPFDDPLFTRLNALAERVIVDSSSFHQPEDGLVHMAQLLEGSQAVSDMSWGRLTPWRELVAQFFDVPSMLPHLEAITSVTIDYEAHAGETLDRTQPLLLAAWLGSKLGWSLIGSPTGGVNMTFSMQRRDGATVQIALRPAAPDDHPDRVAAMTLESEHARFEIARDAQPDCAIARSEIEGRDPLRRVVHLEQLDEASLLAEELRLLGHDRGYEGALRIAARLLGG